MGRLGKAHHNKNTSTAWSELKKGNTDTSNDVKKVFKGINWSKKKREHEKEARRKRRAKKKVCLNCRNPGHLLAECPEPVALSSEAGKPNCFKCGSTEHTSKGCIKNVGKDEYPFAKCFICKEIGHLSGKCPDNPRGLYPHGGGCKFCGSVEHYRKDCPEREVNKKALKEKRQTTGLVMGINNESADAIGDNSDTDEQENTSNAMESNPNLPGTTKKKTKIVKF